MLGLQFQVNFAQKRVKFTRKAKVYEKVAKRTGCQLRTGCARKAKACDNMSKKGTKAMSKTETNNITLKSYIRCHLCKFN